MNLARIIKGKKLTYKFIKSWGEVLGIRVTNLSNHSTTLNRYSELVKEYMKYWISGEYKDI
jgi:hypothetical protein